MARHFAIFYRMNHCIILEKYLTSSAYATRNCTPVQRQAEKKTLDSHDFLHETAITKGLDLNKTT
jgi:hypothetical protein